VCARLCRVDTFIQVLMLSSEMSRDRQRCDVIDCKCDRWERVKGKIGIEEWKKNR
jgi:hypothetical protein